jgi:hypothetical protein
MGNIFHQDFRDFIQTMNDNNVNYMLVSGCSIILLGYYKQMEIWILR